MSLARALVPRRAGYRYASLTTQLAFCLSRTSFSTLNNLAKTSELASLGSEVSDSASRLSSLLAAKNHPEPTTDVAAVPLPRDDPEIQEARDRLLVAAQRLVVLTRLEGIEHYKDVAWSMTEAAAMGVVNELGIAKALPGDGTKMHIDEILTKAGIPGEKDRILPCMRCLVQNYVFKEVEPEYFAHTATSALLLTKPIQAMTELCMEDSYLPAYHLASAIRTHPQSTSPSHAPFNVGHKTPLPYFKALAKNPSRTATFNTAMAAASTGMEILRFVYPWSSLGNATVVEMGGGLGHVSLMLAQEFQDLQFVVQDVEITIKEAQEKSKEEWIVFETQDFFERQRRAADVYFLKNIVHNYNDSDYVQIIRNILPQLQADKSRRILLGESVYKPCGPPPLDRARMQLNMNMLLFFNAKIRTFEEHLQVFKSVDERFELKLYGERGFAGTEVLEATLK